MMFFEQAKKKCAKCEVCEKEFGAKDEKIQADKKTVHKECFKCAFCECELKLGKCAIEPYFNHSYGPLWYCREHSKLGPGEKEEQLVKRGLTPKKKKK